MTFPTNRVLADERPLARLNARAYRLAHHGGICMLFEFTDEELMIRATAERIATERLAPLADKLDRGEGRAELLGISSCSPRTASWR